MTHRLATIHSVQTTDDRLIGLCSVLRPSQHSIGYLYMGDGFLHVKRPNQQYQSSEGKRQTADGRNTVA